MELDTTLTCYSPDRHLLLLWGGHWQYDMVPVEGLLLLELLLLRQGYSMMVDVNFTLTPVFERGLGQRSAAAVTKVHAGSCAPAGAEEQWVHYGAGHELDDTRSPRLLAAGAARAGGLTGRRAAAVRRGRGHGEGVHFLGQMVVVAVGELREVLGGVLVVRANVVGPQRRPARGGVVRGAGPVPQLNGWWMLGEGLRSTWPPSYRF